MSNVGTLLILFEEPEAFLHPCQQEFLNFSLKSLSSEFDQQTIISTHSPVFVSRNIEDIQSLLKLKRERGISKLFQLSENIKNSIMEENVELNSFLKKKLSDPSLDDSIKREIRRKIDGSDLTTKIEKESLRYLLWLDAERCSAFFTDIVLICEGASEKVLLEYLVKNEWYNLREIRPYFLDAMGKYNIHRYMNIFKELGIKHSILADSDKNKKVLELINRDL